MMRIRGVGVRGVGMRGVGMRRVPPGCRELAAPFPRVALRLGERAMVHGHAWGKRKPVGAQCGDAQPQICVAGAGNRAQHVALAQNCGKIACQATRPEYFRAFEHVGEARMRTDARKPAPVCRDAIRGVESLEPAQQIPGLRKRGGRRRIEPAQVQCIPGSPGGEFERQGREIRMHDLRRALRRERGLRALRPESIAHAFAQASGTAAALVGGGLRDLAGHEAAHAGGRVELGVAAQTRVHDHPHAFDGEAGLGNRCGEHDLAHSGGRRRQCSVLQRRSEITIQLVHTH